MKTISLARSKAHEKVRFALVLPRNALLNVPALSAGVSKQRSKIVGHLNGSPLAF